MQVKIEQLPASLQKSLAPVYLISGEEPLQIGEAADQIRLAAKKADYLTREVVDIEQGGEWSLLSDAAESLPLFSEKKLIDLRLPSAKPGGDGGKTLTAYCNNPPENTLLLITAGKLDAAARKSAWYQALDKLGVCIQVWPLQGGELLHWLQNRADKKGMRLDKAAAQSLAARIEGNLLAAAQEIEKLYILHGNTLITKAMIEADVANSARFDVYDLSDAVLGGRLNRSVRILNALKAEGIAAPVILWSLSRDARTLLNVKADLKQGAHADSVFKKYQIWDKRKTVIQQAQARLKTADLHGILQHCAFADRQIKGQSDGDGWESLFEICLRFVNGGHAGLLSGRPTGQ
jgi:DNA polymerase-3 subunit delta